MRSCSKSEMHDFLVLMGRHVLEGIAPVGKIAVPRDINRAAPDAGDGVHDEDHVHDENGIERRSGARIVDALVRRSFNGPTKRHINGPAIDGGSSCPKGGFS